MQEENNFLFKLANNIIEIFNKLFNLSFMLAIFLFLSEILNNKILYGLSVLFYCFLLFHIIYCSHRFYIKKDQRFKISNCVGFSLCIIFSTMLLGLTYSATFLLNMLSSNL